MKCENLNTLKQNGINVPDFSVLLFEELTDDLSTVMNIINEFDPTADSYKEFSQKLKNTLLVNTTPVKRLSLLPDKLYAVRSSCNAEDGSKNSFAGQFDTFLNVSNDDIHSAVSECVKSLYNENVLVYSARNNIDIKKLRMNIIVQEMIDADVSGVLFTSNPLGILNESVITVGKGLGEGVVSDKTETTSYFYNTTDKLYYYDGKENLLSNEKIYELILLSERIKTLFGYDCLDIEFAIKSDVIYVLQVREETTLSTENPTILDNSNIVESYPGISLPLTDSFVKSVYSGVFRGVAFRVLKNKKLVTQYEDTFRNMVGSANGRLYYKISNWYTIIKFLPLSNKIIPVWQEMLGVKNKTYDDEKICLTAFDRLRTYLNSVWELIRVPANMNRLNRLFTSVNNDFYSRLNNETTNEELIYLYNDVKNKLLSVWDITLLNDMYAFIFTGLVKSALKRKHPLEYEEIANSYISGVADIESLKPIKELINLSVLSLEASDSEDYKNHCNKFISIYGDRYLEELKLESETFRTNPDLLDAKIKEYTIDKDKLISMHRSVNKENNCLENKKHGILLSFLLERARLGIKNREISRLNRSRIYGMVREIFLTMAKNFVHLDLIDTEKDIFYLTVDEVFNLATNPEDVRRKVLHRKKEYENYYHLPAYTRLVFAGNEFNKKNKYINTIKAATEKNILTGTPCSNGKVTAEVMIIKDVKDARDTKDKILVTKMTDPGWVFLLATAKGVISEKGSLLSHTAIVSREIGIPSVVGVENALNLLKDGDTVTLDGNSGTIEILR